MRRTSGRARASHHSTLSRRAFSELTFQVAIRTDPRLPRAGPPQAMDVVLGAVRHVEVDDVRQLLDVDAAGGDVGGDEDRDLPRLEAGEGLGPLRLAAVAVDARGVDALTEKIVR